MCGGSVIGLASAMLLARDGHEVTVLEKDAAAAPVDPSRAWDTWRRTGVAQFHQPHNLFAPFRSILEEELPGTVDDLVDAGCVWIDPLELSTPTTVTSSKAARWPPAWPPWETRGRAPTPRRGEG